MKKRIVNRVKVLFIMALMLTAIVIPVSAGGTNNTLNFDGVNDMVSVSPFPSADGDISFTAWVKLDTATGLRSFASWSYSGDDLLFRVSGSSLQLIFNNEALPGGTLPVGSWQHVAFTKSGVNFNVYVNGVLKSSGPLGVSDQTFTAFHLGSLKGTMHFLDGEMDDVGVWNGVLSEAEIQTYSATPLTGSESGLLACYNFDNGVAGGNNAGLTTLDDISSNGNIGTLNNFALSGGNSNWVSAESASVAAVKGLVEGASYTMTQTAAANEAAVKAAIEAKIAALALDGVTPTVIKGTYTPATAGDAGSLAGTNGTYTFTVGLSKGAASDTTTTLTMTITATAFAIESPTWSSGKGYWGDNITANVVGDTLTLSGTGPIRDFGMNSHNGIAEGIKKVVIGEGITRIGIYAFAYQFLEEVEIPNTVTSIGDEAFFNNKLKSLVLPDSVITVGFQAFRLNQLATITFSKNMTKLDIGVFVSNNLTAVVIPSSVTNILSYPFAHNPITSVTIGSNVNITTEDNVDLMGFNKGFRQAYVVNNASKYGIYTFDGVAWNRQVPVAPVAPTLGSKTAASITLTANALNEFSKDGGATWQDSEVFNGLSPLTSYTFVTRVKATSTTNESVASAGTNIITEALPVIGGVVNITGIAKYGQLLTATIVGVNYTPGTVLDGPTYQWKRDGVNIVGATAPTYTLAAADITKAITVTVSADGTHATGSVTSSETAVVAKADGTALTDVSIDDDANTVKGITEDMEFSTNGTDWTAYNAIIPNLPDLTGTITLQVRVKETLTHEAGASSTFNFFEGLTYAMDVINDQTMMTLTTGYTPGTQEEKTITINNAGTGKLENLAVTLDGDDATDFYITQNPATSLNAGAYTTFKIKARDGLPVETYTATVTVSATNMTDETFTVTQIVEAAQAVNATISPMSVNFDLNAPTDITTSITWNSAQTVTGSVYKIQSLSAGTDYTIEGNILTIKKDYISNLNLAEGDLADFEIIFDVGDRAVIRVKAVRDYVNSTDAYLSSLILSSGALSPGFVSGTTSYTQSVANGISSIALTPITSESHATVTVNGNAVSSGNTSNPINLNVGSNIITITSTAQDNITTKTYTVMITRAEASSGGNDNGGSGGSGAGGSATPVTQPKTGADILVNGKTLNGGTSVDTVEQGRTITTVTVDEKKLEQKLAIESGKTVVTIPVNTDSDVVAGELNGQMVKNMENKQATIKLKTMVATYTLPAQQINIDTISRQIGKDVALKDIKVSIEIAKPAAETIKVLEDAANQGAFTIVVPSVGFSVKCIYGNQVIELKKFNSYIERTIAIPEGVDPSKIMTGIVVDPDGSVRHVPTKILLIEGKYYAKINSLTNSTYSVVWHPITFTDTDAHWAKEAINDMGSRMVINGVGNDKFNPDRDITRGEFAAIMVKALGLKPGTGNNLFDDVNESDWYCASIETATEHNIISGYGKGKFGPMDKITREQAMSMIARAMNTTGLKVDIEQEEIQKLLAEFGDARGASEYAKTSIATCIKTGVMSGKDGNMTEVKGNITRAEVAVIVRRLLQKSNLI